MARRAALDEATNGVGVGATGQRALVSKAAARVTRRAPVPAERAGITLRGTVRAVGVGSAFIGRGAGAGETSVSLVGLPAVGAGDVAYLTAVVAWHAGPLHTPLHAGDAIAVRGAGACSTRAARRSGPRRASPARSAAARTGSARHLTSATRAGKSRTREKQRRPNIFRHGPDLLKAPLHAMRITHNGPQVSCAIEQTGSQAAGGSEKRRRLPVRLAAKQHPCEAHGLAGPRPRGFDDSHPSRPGKLSLAPS